MGGSGGGGYSLPGKSLSELEADRSKREESEGYEREVNQELQGLLTELNDRDVEQINQHLQLIKDSLEKEVEGYFDLRFGGSVSKNTYSNGLSDVDMLVQINNSSLENAKPEAVLKYFADKISERLPRTSVEIGTLAVTVKFSNGHEIQLLPSLKTATGYKIAKPGANDWSNVIKPQNFANKLTDTNQLNGGKVVPVIKLLKKINANLPDPQKLSGYHIESLAIDAFKNGSDDRTYKGMIKQFCRHAEKAVLEPIKDSTGQSVHADDYLGSSNSLERRQRSQAFKMLQKKIHQADNSNNVNDWNDLLK